MRTWEPMMVGAVVGKVEREMLDQHQAFPINWLSGWMLCRDPLQTYMHPTRRTALGCLSFRKYRQPDNIRQKSSNHQQKGDCFLASVRWKISIGIPLAVLWSRLCASYAGIQEVQVQSLFVELRSHMSHGQIKINR